ncbi:unnamed protein product, partial [Larinioides sclopetarius]
MKGDVNIFFPQIHLPGLSITKIEKESGSSIQTIFPFINNLQWLYTSQQ